MTTPVTAEDIPNTPAELNTEILPLTTQETCDRCGDGTQGAVKIVTTKGDLVFCWHHGRKFGRVSSDFDERHVIDRSKGSDH